MMLKNVRIETHKEDYVTGECPHCGEKVRIPLSLALSVKKFTHTCGKDFRVIE